MKNKNKSSRKINHILKIYVILNFLFIIILTISFYLSVSTKDQVHFYPQYQKIELLPVIERIIDKGETYKHDYQLLLYQTGLGKPVINEILEDKKLTERERIDKIINAQTDFFNSVEVVRKKFGIVTYEDRVVDKKKQPVISYDIYSLKDGDILITKATHTFGWRHGHAAIVIDKANKKILEAALIGYNSQISSIDKWRSYGSFILLRLKEDLAKEKGLTQSEAGRKIAALAKENLYDLPYGLFTGIPVKAQAIEILTKTQCAHLVWYPYYQSGYDIDSDGSWLVTPKDIANSDCFEIVQVFGVNPREIWP